MDLQELLHMFVLPYIIAPMEAEAPCSYIELANYVDGTVTDDADVFLFGARSVYKNIFDDRKYVETYFMKDPAIVGKFDVQTGLGVRKKESKVGGSEANCIDTSAISVIEEIPNLNLCREM
uniref:XPG-I domain-containing protein n=1 Tax=Salix viminalis TaxID=40686 RepID=A0A6N2M8M6_SALVM